MKTTVQILVHAKNKVDTQHTVSTGAGSSGKPLILKATKGVKYELRDNGIKFAPDQVLAKRNGNNLEINLDDDGEKNIDAEADIVIENYYTESNAELIGLAEDGKYYPYLPQEADPSLLVDSMPDGMFSYQSLGIESGFNPIWLLALAPLGFIGSGGGSGGSIDDSENLPPRATNNILTSIYEDIFPPSETGNVITDDDGFGVDSDPDGDTLTVIAIRLGSETESGTSGTVDGISQLKGAYGYLIIAADGTYTYIIDNASLSTQSLAADEIVTEIFTYTISDGNGGISSATLEIDIHGKNDAPVAVDDLAITDEDTPVTIDVLVNDSDIDDGDLLTITGVTQGVHGTVTIDLVTGNPIYTPDPNWSGTDTFTYTISDGNGGTDTATVTVNITSADDFPLAADDSFNATEDTTYNGNLTTNDTPSGDGGNVWSKTTDPTNGSVVVNSDGTFIYTPNANYNGTDSFTYTITDTNGDTSTATVAITVIPVNDAFIDVNEIVNVDEDTTLTGSVLTGTTSIDGPVTVTQFVINGTTYSAGSTASLAEGTLQINSDGSYTFIPIANYNGPVPVATYTMTDGSSGDVSTLTITVTPLNDDFTDANEIVNTPEDTTLTGSVLTGTISVDGPVTITTFMVAGDVTVYSAGETATIADVGTLLINFNGDYAFIPEANYNGSVPVVTYTLTDGSGVDDTSTLAITVTPLNDDFTDDNEIVTTLENNTKTGNVIDGISTDGPITVTTFTVAGDATIYSAGSTASLAEGTLQINSDGSYTFIPIANYNGPVPIATYTMTDGSSGDVSTLTITVTPLNDDFTDDNEIVTILEDTTKTGNVIDGISVDGPITITTFTVAGDVTVYSAGSTASLAEGTLQINSDGNYTFIPIANYNGSVPVVTYTLTDGSGLDDTSTLAITVIPVNDAFIDVNEIVNVDEDTTLTGSVLTGTTSIDGPVTVTQFVINGTTYSAGSTASLAEGTLQINSDGSYTFIPIANYNGPVPVATYTMTDGSSGDVSTLTITVTPLNDDFTDANEIVNTPEDTTLTGSVLTGTTSVDGPVTVTQFVINGTTYSGGSTASLAEGTLQINSDGSYTFIPIANYNGPVPVATYTMTDGSGVDDTSTLTITVTPVDDDVAIIVTDENGGINGGHITVYEKALAIIGSDSALSTETTTGTFVVTAPDGLAKITVDTTDVTISQLENLGTTPIDPINVLNGMLTITGYDGDTGVVSYSYTLTSPDTTTPNANDGINTTTQNISLSATDVDGDVVTGVIAVGIVDDVPNAPIHNITVDVPQVDTNLLITIDLSYSMSEQSGVAGLTRLELQQIAILDMIAQYDALGDVMVQIVTFSAEATVHGTTWMTVDEAKAIILGLVVDDVTDYDAALAGAMDGFDNPGKIPDGQNISYFFSDGKPTEGDDSIGIVGAEVTAWTDFLVANDIKSYAIGLGSGVDDTDLNPIAYNGIDNTEMDALVVTNLSALMSTLSATITPPSNSGDLSGNTSVIHNFGADGGYISNITFDGISYAYDGVGTLTTTGTGYTFDTTTHVLTQTTANGSTIELDMDDGIFDYTTPAVVAVAYNDHFVYSITDHDGDISTNTADIHVNSNLTPTDLIINGTSGDDMLVGEQGNDTINGLGGNDVLSGDGGNDIIIGGAGDDNLLGSDGNDILNGDSGNDYLYGDIGNDILISDLRTIDITVAGDTNLGSVDGGVGFDTFRMIVDGTIINFDAWSGTDSVLKNIEVIDLSAGGASDNHNLTNITYSDVVNMTDSDNDLWILGDSGDNVTFSGVGWSQSAGTVTETINGASHTFYGWTNINDGTVMVKVESSVIQ